MVSWAYTSLTKLCGSTVYEQLTRASNTYTDIQTKERATSVAIGRICTMRAMQPNNK